MIKMNQIFFRQLFNLLQLPSNLEISEINHSRANIELPSLSRLGSEDFVTLKDGDCEGKVREVSFKNKWREIQKTSPDDQREEKKD
jgi:hypothetical protein